ncbi:GNAT family N-acetyltransferase [Nocardioides caeni]|uniref:GNAT family N-acetyltransferase n=1 Tax=Nocardioides caeni TaxID=574700 RepID=A0A4S8MZN1_9ACTN|nr:GNAT family N-acetyltransferase [Nocardioides caeni]THV08938.1 GNAT family N-acetyltransferase [Nocardioides caeni]
MTAPLIRPILDVDRDAVAAVITAAFADEGDHVAALWADVVARGHARAELVAEDGDGAIAGHVGLSHAWLDTRPELVDVLVLSPLSVVPERQGTGVGAALLAAAVAEAERLGAPLVVLEGDPGYYGRRGWEPASVHGIESPSRRIPGPAFQMVALPAREPWMTGRVVYRDVWWDHDAAGLRDPVLAQVEMNLPD